MQSKKKSLHNLGNNVFLLPGSLALQLQPGPVRVLAGENSGPAELPACPGEERAGGRVQAVPGGLQGQRQQRPAGGPLRLLHVREGRQPRHRAMM